MIHRMLANPAYAGAFVYGAVPRRRSAAGRSAHRRRAAAAAGGVGDRRPGRLPRLHQLRDLPGQPPPAPRQPVQLRGQGPRCAPGGDGPAARAGPLRPVRPPDGRQLRSPAAALPVPARPDGHRARRVPVVPGRGDRRDGRRGVPRRGAAGGPGGDAGGAAGPGAKSATPSSGSGSSAWSGPGTRRASPGGSTTPSIPTTGWWPASWNGAGRRRWRRSSGSSRNHERVRRTELRPLEPAETADVRRLAADLPALWHADTTRRSTASACCGW